MSYINVDHFDVGRCYILREDKEEFYSYVTDNVGKDGLVGVDDMVFIKAGRTAQPNYHKRLVANQVGNPRRLTHEWISQPIPNHKKFEEHMKRLLKDFHVSGEWYLIAEWHLCSIIDELSQDVDDILDRDFYGSNFEYEAACDMITRHVSTNMSMFFEEDPA